MGAEGILYLSGWLNYEVGGTDLTVTAEIPGMAGLTQVQTPSSGVSGLENGWFSFSWSAADLGDGFNYDGSGGGDKITITMSDGSGTAVGEFLGKVTVDLNSETTQQPLNTVQPGAIVMFAGRKFLVASAGYVDAAGVAQPTTYVMQVGAEQVREFNYKLTSDPFWNQVETTAIGYWLNNNSTENETGYFHTLPTEQKSWVVETVYGYGGCEFEIGTTTAGCNVNEINDLQYRNASYITLPSTAEWRNNGLNWSQSLEDNYFQHVFVDLGSQSGNYFLRTLRTRTLYDSEAVKSIVHIGSGGKSLTYTATNTALGVHPTLNLKSDLVVCSGTGTLNNPYYLGDGSCNGVNGTPVARENSVESLKTGQVIQLGAGTQARQYMKVGDTHQPKYENRYFWDLQVTGDTTIWRNLVDDSDDWLGSDIQVYLKTTLLNNDAYLSQNIKDTYLEQTIFNVGPEQSETALAPNASAIDDELLYAVPSVQEWLAYGVDYCRAYSGEQHGGCNGFRTSVTTSFWLRTPKPGTSNRAFRADSGGTVVYESVGEGKEIIVGVNLQPNLYIDPLSGNGTKDNPFCLTNEAGTIDSCNTAPVISIDQNSNGESGEGGSGGSGSGPSNIMIEKSGEWGTLSGKIVDLDNRQQLKVEVQIYSNNLTDEEIESQINGIDNINPPLFTKIATVDNNGATPTLTEGNNWVINLNYDKLIQLYENNVSDFLNKSFTQIRVVGFDNKGGMDFLKYEGILALNTPPNLDYLPPLIQLPTSTPPATGETGEGSGEEGTGEGETGEGEGGSGGEPTFTHPCEYIDNSTNPPTVTPDFDICLSEEMILRGNVIDIDEGQQLTLTITLTNPVTYESITSETYTFSNLSPFPTQNEIDNSTIDPTTESGFIISFPFSQLMQLGNSFNITYSLSDSITTTTLTDPLTYTIYPTLDLIQAISSQLPTTFSGTIFSQSPEELSASGFIHLQDLSADYSIYTQPLWLYHQLSNDTTPNPYPHPFLVKFIPESSKTGVIQLKGK